nr:alpha-amylase family glycosyl hydrolase [uncultured Friedmanniella sp.]
MSTWVEHVIWWQVYPLGFVGAEKELARAQPEPHRLARLHGWLDHLVALGANGLALGPVFTSRTHGYDTVDYHQIDPRLGDDGDFDALVAACRERGIRVLLDGVFNHAGRDFGPVREALDGGADSEAGRWIHWSEGYPVFFEGHDQLVALNHEAVEVQDLVVEVMTHWLERGADGWRLDAAYAVPPEFWAAVLPRVRERFPDAWFVGEMIHGDYGDYVQRSGLDSITQYELWKATWSSLRERNFWELDWTLGRHRALLAELLPLTFIGNHDVTRIATQVSDARHVPHAVALLFFLPGVPSVYYGDEYGLRATKEDRVGGDDAIRPEMPGAPSEVPHADAEIWSVYQRMIGLRRRQPWLTRASTSTSAVANEHLLVHATDGDHRLTLALNLADAPFPLPPGLGAALEAGAPVRDGAVTPHSWAVLEG